MKKIIALAFLLLSLCGVFAHGGHSGHGGHHAGRHGGHHFNRRGGHYDHQYRRGGYGHRYGRGYGWRSGWAWGGRPGWWRLGARAATFGGLFYFAGFTYAQWQLMAQQDAAKRIYFETVVVPAYNKYQQDPNSIASYDASPEMEASAAETNIDVYTYNNDYVSVRRCCTDASSNWFGAGPDRAWREENIAPDNFSIYRRSEFRPVSFTDLSEQPQISGFETSVYTSPK